MSLFADLGILLAGAVMGFFIAMPVGPVAFLTAKRTLHIGWPAGVATGLGAAAADTFYAAVAAFGVYAVQEFLVNHQYSLRLVGGALLLLLGLRMLLQKAAVPGKPADGDSAEADPHTWHRLLRSFITGMFLTAANPLTLVAFLTLCTNFGLAQEMNTYKAALWFVAGALLGASGWWLSLVGAVTLVKARISETLIAKINAVLAVFLVTSGAYAIISGLWEKPLPQLLR